MRIGTGVALPTPPPPTLTPAAAVLDRAVLLRVAALADQALRPIFDLPAHAPAGGTAPPTAREALAIAAALQALAQDGELIAAHGGTPAGLPAQALSALLGASLPAVPPGAAPGSIPGTAPGIPAGPASTALPVTLASALTLAAAAVRGADRLSLSPAVTALRLPPIAGTHAPVIELTLALLTALTGEARSRVQLLAHDAALGAEFSTTGGFADPLTAASQIGKPAADVLQLLVRGSLRTLDAKLVDLTLGLTVQRQPGTATLDDAALATLRTTLEQLAHRSITSDFPGDAATLAGQSARFHAMLDPVGLWPMQSFLLSGLLLFGAARDIDPTDDLDEIDDRDDAASVDMDSDDDGDADARSSDQQAADQQLAPPEAAKGDQSVAISIDDGGPPVISASAWLELELRHWRTQLRLWMSLPGAG